MSAKVVCVLLLLVVSTTLARPTVDDAPILDNDLIDEVNQHGKWRAGLNKQFFNMTVRDARCLAGTFIESSDDFTLPVKSSYGNVELPETFDARSKWPNSIHGIRNQAQCGSCWAFAATEALSDRFAIESDNKINVVLSPQQLVSCDTKDGNMGCGGGYPLKAWQYMMSSGVVSDDCYQYTSGNGNSGECLLSGSNNCPSGSGSSKLYHAASAYRVEATMTAIMEEIYDHGPVEAAFMVYQDFYSYKSGVYEHFAGGLVGGHAVKIIGWGTEDGTPYWLIANSWGTSWADLNGFFMMKRGVNECGIESRIVAGLAKTS